MITQKSLISLIFLLVILSVKCKKEQPVDTDHSHHHGSSEGTGTVSLTVNFKAGTDAFSMDSVYQDQFGNNYKFTLVKCYLGNIGFEDHDNIITPPAEAFVLLDPNISNYNLGNIAANHYHNLKFNIGMDSLTNHTDPNTYSPTSPLYPQTPSMHWTWNSGYIFYKLEGLADTNNDMTFESNFSFHIGTDVLNRSNSLTIHKDIIKDQSNIISINADLTKFLTNVNLDTERQTHSASNIPLVIKIADNGATVFAVP